MNSPMIKKMPLLALLAAAAFSLCHPAQGAQTPTTIATAQAPATEYDVLKAYGAASAQATADLKIVEDANVYAFRLAQMRAEADYDAKTAPAKKSTEQLENAFNESYRTDYWKAEDRTKVLTNQANAIREAATSQAREVELAANRQALLDLNASVKQANDAFAAQVNGRDPNSDALKPARETLKIALQQLGKQYADAVVNSHATSEAAVLAADNANHAAEMRAWELREVARRPGEESRDYMHAQFDVSLAKTEKPALEEKNAAIGKADERFKKEMASFYKARDDARLKRLEIWQRYEAGTISANAAVSELTQLVHP